MIGKGGTLGKATGRREQPPGSPQRPWAGRLRSWGRPVCPEPQNVNKSVIPRASSPGVAARASLPGGAGRPESMTAFPSILHRTLRGSLCIMLSPEFPASSLGHVPRGAISGPEGKVFVRSLWRGLQVSMLFFFLSHLCFFPPNIVLIANTHLGLNLCQAPFQALSDADSLSPGDQPVRWGISRCPFCEQEP